MNSIRSFIGEGCKKRWQYLCGIASLLLLSLTASANEPLVGPRFAFSTTNPDSLVVVNKYFIAGDYVSIAAATKLPELGIKIGKTNQYKLAPNLNTVSDWSGLACDQAGSASIIIYDNEPWDATPVAEQKAILKSINKGAELVSNSGCRKFGIAPARAFLSKSRQACYSNTGRLNFQIDWKKIGLLVIQAQGMLQDKCIGKYGVENYKAFVGDIARVAKQANPELIVFAEVSFNRARPEIIIQAIDNTRHLVDGFYLAYPDHESCKFCTPENLEIVLSKYRAPQ